MPRHAPLRIRGPKQASGLLGTIHWSVPYRHHRPPEGSLDVRTIVELAQVRWPGGPGVRARAALCRAAGSAEPRLRPGAGSPGVGDRAGARPVDPGRPPAAGPERGLRRRGRARQAERGVHPLPADRARHPAAAAAHPAGDGAVLLAPLPPAARDRAGERLRVHHLGGRLHPDQQPRGRGRRTGHRPPAGPAGVQGQGHRDRSQHRRRGAQDRRPLAAARGSGQQR